MKQHKLVDMCESPIEVIFLEEIYETLGIEWKIEPQVKIGNFRVDFLISRQDGEWIDEYTKALIIECNGKKFHSEPEKVRKDQLRENFLNLLNYRVFPFKGTTIYNEMEDIARFVKWYLTTPLKPDAYMHPSSVIQLHFWDGSREFNFHYSK